VGHEIAAYGISAQTKKFVEILRGYTDSETGQYWLFLEYWGQPAGRKVE